MTTSNLSIRGIYRDVIHDGGQRVVYDSGWVSNTIVTRCRVLLASFVKNQLTAGGQPAAGGIHHLAVGQGDKAWDDPKKGITSPDPDASTALLNPQTPAIDAAELEIVYLDASDVVQQTPSPRLQITATLGAGYPPPLEGTSTYPLREFGLFGWLGDQETGEAYMINSIRHPLIPKEASATLRRVVRLYF